MKSLARNFGVWCLLVGLAWGQENDATDIPVPPLPDDVEVLSRGPVHEAFAEPLPADESDGQIVTSEPPAPIEELPPDAKPEGDNVQWISGYWAWDEDRDDYIWVSGVWRRLPPGREWSAGHWEQVDGGYEWVSGHWQMANADVVDEVLPVPPASIEEGPTSEAPTEDHFWIPGAWRYQANRYVWRPGFWSGCHDNWVWVPDAYAPVVGGCVYVPGYWDYAWERRGTLFAPCYIGAHVRHRPHRFVHRPSVVIDLALSFGHFWVRPNCGHYYFGDYYDDTYLGIGFHPWYRYHHIHRHAYDPLFVHYRWRYHRDGANLYRHLHNRHHHYRNHVDLRPSRVYAHHRQSGVKNHIVRDKQHARAARGQGLAHHIDQHDMRAARDIRRDSIRRTLLSSNHANGASVIEQAQEIHRKGGKGRHPAVRDARNGGAVAATQAAGRANRDRSNGDTKSIAGAGNRGPNRGIVSQAGKAGQGSQAATDHARRATRSSTSLGASDSVVELRGNKSSVSSGPKRTAGWLESIRSTKGKMDSKTDSRALAGQSARGGPKAAATSTVRSANGTAITTIRPSAKPQGTTSANLAGTSSRNAVDGGKRSTSAKSRTSNWMESIRSKRGSANTVVGTRGTSERTVRGNLSNGKQASPPVATKSAVSSATAQRSTLNSKQSVSPVKSPSRSANHAADRTRPRSPSRTNAHSSTRVDSIGATPSSRGRSFSSSAKSSKSAVVTSRSPAKVAPSTRSSLSSRNRSSSVTRTPSKSSPRATVSPARRATPRTVAQPSRSSAPKVNRSSSSQSRSRISVPSGQSRATINRSGGGRSMSRSQQIRTPARNRSLKGKRK